MSDARWVEVEAAVDSHADLIRRVARPLRNRPAVLTADLVDAADESRQFRNVAARAYDKFNQTKAGPAVAAARRLFDALPAAIARFRQAIDP
jgi:hypothetical protein